MKEFLILCIIIVAVIYGLVCASNSIQRSREEVHKLNESQVDITSDRFKILQNGYAFEDREIEGMKYKIFFARPTGVYASKAIFAINVAKDKLEVDLLKKQLNVQ